jgi:DNA invertase Pin-like site-specific DNA recombinase
LRPAADPAPLELGERRQWIKGLVRGTPKRAGIYVRVSTATKSRQGDSMGYDQNPAVQEQPLQDLIAQQGWTLHKVFRDRVSGPTERRPGLDALMADARRGAFEVVVVFRFDRSPGV